MTASRTTNLVLAGALGIGTLVGFAAPALADTPPAGQELVVVLGEGGGGLDGPGGIVQPQPAPQPPKDKAPGPQQPDPKPIPAPGPGEILHPEGHGDPEPGDWPIANPEDDGPVVNPEIPPGPGDIEDDEGCNATHGCEPEVPDDFADQPKDGDGCHPLAASCDLVDRDPVDPEDTPPTPGTPEDGVEVLDHTESRGVLPRTGAGLAGIGLAGGALTGLGAALRKLARRR